MAFAIAGVGGAFGRVQAIAMASDEKKAEHLRH